MGVKDLSEELDKLLDLCIAERDITPFIEAVWNLELYPTQRKIVNTIFFKKNTEIAINTYTRYGKTFSVAVGLMTVIYVYGKKGLRVGLAGPSFSDAELVRNELLKIGIRFDGFKDIIDMSRGSNPEDLIKSSKKEKLTFYEGKTELELVSASGGVSNGLAGTGKGSGAMGKGYDYLVLDESTRVPWDAWKKYLSRLLEHEQAVRIEMANPWHKQNHFYQHWMDDEVATFFVDEEKGLEEGRHSKAWFDKQAKEVDGRDTLEWKVLYMSVFPDRSEHGLISYSDFNSCKKGFGWEEKVRAEGFEPDGVFYGFDVAGEGKDKAVLIRAVRFGDFWEVSDVWSRDYVEDTMELVGWAGSRIDSKDVTVRVDSNGIGKGVCDRLRELGYNASGVNVGKNPKREKHRFVNRKARLYWRVKKVFSGGRVRVVADGLGKLGRELTGVEYRHNSREKIRVKDPDSGSPDFADSLMLCFSGVGNEPGFAEDEGDVLNWGGNRGGRDDLTSDIDI